VETNEELIYEKILGRILNKSVLIKDKYCNHNTQITPKLIKKFKEKKKVNFM
jgi:hypothetical protein